MKVAESKDQVGGFQLLLLVLSIYVLGAMFVETVFQLSSEVLKLLDIVDSLICLVFLSDFFTRLYRAENKRAFLKWGWIDFVSSIPNLPFIRVGRLFSVMRLFRMLRTIRSAKILAHFVYRNRARGALWSAGLMGALLVIFSSIAILNCERDPKANIKTGNDALLWSLATLGNMSSGDKYPVTPEGRVIGAVLMLGGVALVSTFTAFIASFFLEPGGKKEEEKLDLVLEEVRVLRQKIEQLEAGKTNKQTAVQGGLHLAKISARDV